MANETTGLDLLDDVPTAPDVHGLLGQLLHSDEAVPVDRTGDVVTLLFHAVALLGESRRAAQQLRTDLAALRGDLARAAR